MKPTMRQLMNEYNDRNYMRSQKVQPPTPAVKETFHPKCRWLGCLNEATTTVRDSWVCDEHEEAAFAYLEQHGALPTEPEIPSGLMLEEDDD